MDFKKCDIEFPDLDCIEILDKQFVNDIDLVLEKINDVDNIENLNQQPIFDELDFVVIKIKEDIDLNLSEFMIIKKYFLPNTVFRQSFKFLFKDGIPIEVKENVLVLTSNVDCIYFKDEFYIDNRKNFMSIFKFDDFFKQKIIVYGK